MGPRAGSPTGLVVVPLEHALFPPPPAALGTLGLLGGLEFWHGAHGYQTDHKRASLGPQPAGLCSFPAAPPFGTLFGLSTAPLSALSHPHPCTQYVPHGSDPCLPSLGPELHPHHDSIPWAVVPPMPPSNCSLFPPHQTLHDYMYILFPRHPSHCLSLVSIFPPHCHTQKNRCRLQQHIPLKETSSLLQLAILFTLASHQSVTDHSVRPILLPTHHQDYAIESSARFTLNFGNYLFASAINANWRQNCTFIPRHESILSFPQRPANFHRVFPPVSKLPLLAPQ